MSDITKQYTNGEVTIVWQPGLCSHSRVCWHGAAGLPEVFNPAARPWITPEGASTARIIDQVKRCPSGALSFYMNGETNSSEVSESVRAEIVADGPLLIHGSLTIKSSDGSEISRSRVTAFCRCGASANKPFCDGSHTRIGFKG